MNITTKTADQLSAAQRNSYRKVVDFVTWRSDHEVKDSTITGFEFGGNDVLVTIETGIAKDEGTLAEYLCRSMYMFFIGERGGIYYYENGRRRYCKYYEVKDERSRF